VPAETTGATEPDDPAANTGVTGATGAPADPASDDGTAPDFSACIGLHGLDNAICRHEALVAVDPNNEGLQRSLDQLLANQAKHDDEGSSSDPTANGSGDDEAQDPSDGGGSSSHGQSDEPHGRSDEPHGHSDEDHGNPNGD
jgi:hypothetical protein